MFGISQLKCKCPFEQQEEKAFLCRQGQVLQATASLIKRMRIQIWRSCWGFPVGFPLQSAVGCDWYKVKINNRWYEMEEGWCYMKVKMTDEIADLAKYFILAICC